jgi:hypothetical protein
LPGGTNIRDDTPAHPARRDHYLGRDQNSRREKAKPGPVQVITLIHEREPRIVCGE